MPRSVTRPWLFEAAWEVANKVGGIYTVIRTKAPVTVAEYGNRYVLMGPLNQRTAPMEVEHADPGLVSRDLRDALDVMGKHGVRWTFGRWLIDGAPWVVLFDLSSVTHKLDEWRLDMATNYGVPSPPTDTETNDAIMLGYCIAWLIGEFMHREKNNALIAHFHEWQAGVALPLIRRRGFDVATVFTTHATLLGRYLCAGSVDFYNNLEHFDVDAESGRRGIYHRYCIERAAAHSAQVFTTVSHITAWESEHLLKRKPDGVLPNGLNVVKFAAMHEFQNLHAVAKSKIHDFVRGHFYGHLGELDFENTLYFFTAGRQEFRNKGVDMFLESLARLNGRLKAMGSKMTVVAFVIMPAPNHSFTVETLKGHAVIKSLKDTVSDIQKEIGKRLFEQAARGVAPDPGSALMTAEETVLLKRRVYAMKRDALPPVVTHNMVDDAGDPVLGAVRRLQLFNAPHDRVKVVYHPEFLNANNPLFGLDYEEFVRGCHLGVFPSYYEPWGYTPAECTVMGVPSITTNLSGFGCYMEEIIETPDDYGIYIVDRRLKSVDESVEHLADKMLSFCLKSRRQRINLRNRTERLSDILDWKRMGLEYVKARHLALKRTYPASFARGHNSGGGGGAQDYYASSPSGTSDGGGSLPKTPGEQPRVGRPLSAPGSPRTRSHPHPHLMADEDAPDHVLNKLEELGLAHDDDEE
ncbi:glycogen synthase [Blastocladiella britannica]|nr:glycogen synthase [Blastocladiella britannica]